MKTKSLYLTIVPLLSLSLLSVGFCSWTLTDAEVFNANIQTGNALILNDYIKYNDQVDFFEFCPTGPIDNETIVSYGDVVISFRIENFQKLLSRLEPTSSKTLQCTIRNICTTDQNFSIFNYFSSTNQAMYSESLNTEAQNFSKALNYTIEAANLNFSLSLTNFTDQNINTIYYSFKFSFDFSSVLNDFNNQIYSKIGNNGLFFRIQAEIN